MIFSWSRRGNAIPFSLIVSAPCGLIAFILKYYGTGNEDFDYYLDSNMNNSIAWIAFTIFCGLLTFYRAAQSCQRFWDSHRDVQDMAAYWFDAASNLVAFCRYSTCDRELVLNFRQKLLRLLSLLHAVAHSDLGNRPSTLDALDHIDIEGLDVETLRALKDSKKKVELVYQWVQALIVDHIRLGVLSISPAILARGFQNMSEGISTFYSAAKYVDMPDPLPYKQIAEVLLVLHWIITPIVTCSWTLHAIWAGLFCFVQCFIFWSFSALACELENPFGHNVNKHRRQELQRAFNERMLSLLQCQDEVFVATGFEEKPLGTPVKVGREAHVMACPTIVQQPFAICGHTTVKCADLDLDACGSLKATNDALNESLMVVPSKMSSPSATTESASATTESTCIPVDDCERKLWPLGASSFSNSDVPSERLAEDEYRINAVPRAAVRVNCGGRSNSNGSVDRAGDAGNDDNGAIMTLQRRAGLDSECEESNMIIFDLDANPIVLREDVAAAVVPPVQSHRQIPSEHASNTNHPTTSTRVLNLRKNPAAKLKLLQAAAARQKQAKSRPNGCQMCEQLKQEPRPQAEEIVLDWSGASPAMKGIVGLDTSSINFEIATGPPSTREPPWDISRLIVQL